MQEATQEAGRSSDEDVAALAERHLEQAREHASEAARVLREAGWTQGRIDEFLIGIRPG